MKRKTGLNVTPVLQGEPSCFANGRYCVTVIWLAALLLAPVWAQDAPPKTDDAPDIKPIQIDWPLDNPGPSAWPAQREAPTGGKLSLTPATEPDASPRAERPFPKQPGASNSGPSADNSDPEDDPDAPPGDALPPTGFQWGEATRQAMLFNAIQHALRFATEDGTRKEIKGPFFRDWFQSVRNLRGWRDGDPFLVNYIGHPIMGAASGYIQIHNDPKGQRLEFEPRKKTYWKSRMKAMAWSAVYSAQFELGPISEASLGNVGRAPRPDGKSPMSYVDLVITPTVGTLWLVGEDALDKHLIERFEGRVRNQFWRGIMRSFLNPGRSVANAMRFKWPWHRDRRKL